MHALLADALHSDPRVAKAGSLIEEALADYSKQICHIRPPHAGQSASYEELIAKAGALRGAALWYPYIGSGLGNGPFVELCDGSWKLDLISGIGVYPGHSAPQITRASLHAAIDNSVLQGNLQQNREAIELMDQLTQSSGLDHCFLTTSGAMANENALKIAFQKRPKASRILCFSRCLAGRTWSLAQVTDRPQLRDGLPLNVQVDYIPFFDEENPEESVRRSLLRLREHLARYPGQHAAMFFELIQGEGGVYAGSTDFFRALIEELRMANVLLIADEVQTFGRTTRPFAFQHFGLEEAFDIVTVGKLAQVCATLFRKQVAPRPGLLSQTFISSSSAIRSASATLKLLEKEGCFGLKGKNQWIQEAFANRFQGLKAKHPHWIDGPYGVGSMVAFTPLSGSREKVIQLAKRLFHNGVIGFVAGDSPMRLRFLVPTCFMSEAIIDAAFDVLSKSLEEVA